ncbi:hypothetical protein MJA45_15895 [Paenibacillus aurantius]|uniref:Uncharacterized protein n=1 Tax=Paenibacillus aurantius TaxID=2918900 RepID=A0AA96L8N9_9BACL|nr:hypothetical protein [Paenibacillus aurantius]WNQ09129.1 hypothetical protein MJA45_15895 [Paenibacillus aurantius]
MRSAVGETVKVTAAHMGPVETLYVSAKEKASETKPAILLGEVLSRIRNARDTVVGAEESAAKYEEWIPDSVLAVIEWEKEQREHWEQEGKDGVDQVIDQTVTPMLNKAFKPVVLHYGNRKILKEENLEIVKISFPELGNHARAGFGIEVSYAFQLPVPFFHKTVMIRKKAYERVWVGQ